MTTSCQPRPQPHSSGMAASSASSGTATNTPTRTRWKVELGSSSMSGLAGRIWVLVAPPPAGEVGATAGSVALAASGGGKVVASATLTVSGDVVIVLLVGTEWWTGTLVRLRNRSLRDRRLGKAWPVNFCS